MTKILVRAKERIHHPVLEHLSKTAHTLGQHGRGDIGLLEIVLRVVDKDRYSALDQVAEFPGGLIIG